MFFKFLVIALATASSLADPIERDELIVGGDPSTWSPTEAPVEEEEMEKIILEPLVPEKIIEPEVYIPLLVGGDPSTWSPTEATPVLEVEVDVPEIKELEVSEPEEEEEIKPCLEAKTDSINELKKLQDQDVAIDGWYTPSCEADGSYTRVQTMSTAWGNEEWCVSPDGQKDPDCDEVKPLIAQIHEEAPEDDNPAGAAVIEEGLGVKGHRRVVFGFSNVARIWQNALNEATGTLE